MNNLSVFSISLPSGLRSSPHHRWLVLGVVGFAIVATGIDNGMINLAMPRLAETFGVEADVILWLSAGFMVVAVGLVLTWSSLGDSIGRRRVYMAGFLFFTLGLGVMSVSQSVAHLITGRIIQAIGQSMLVTNGYAIAVSAFPDTERGKVVGTIGAFVGVGLTLGPIFGGYVLENFDWRALFWTRLPLGLIAFTVVALVVPADRPSRENRRFDYGGGVALFITLTSLLLVINRGPYFGFTSPTILALSATTLVGAVAFALIESRAPEPVINFALFRNRYLSASLGVHFLHFLAYMFMTFLLPFYLLSGGGLSEGTVGLLLALIQVVRLFSAPFSAWVTDRLGARAVASAGTAFTAIGLFFLSQLQVTSSLTEIVVALLITGIGTAVFDPANEHAILNSVPSDRLSSAAGLIATSRQTGFSIGSAVSGTLYAVLLLRHEAPEAGLLPEQAVVVAYQEVMLIGLAVMLAGLVLSILRGPIGPTGARNRRAAASVRGEVGRLARAHTSPPFVVASEATSCPNVGYTKNT